MRTIPSEYKILVEYVNPDERGVSPYFTHPEDQQSLTNILEEVFEHLAESIPEGWQVNSHNITAARETLIVTVLLKRVVKIE